MPDHPMRKGEDLPHDELLGRLQVIRPAPGELVLVSVPAGMGMDAQAMMMDQLRRLELGVRLVVLTRDLELAHIPDPVTAGRAQQLYDELHAILAGETNRPPPYSRRP